MVLHNTQNTNKLFSTKCIKCKARKINLLIYSLQTCNKKKDIEVGASSRYDTCIMKRLKVFMNYIYKDIILFYACTYNSAHIPLYLLYVQLREKYGLLIHLNNLWVHIFRVLLNALEIIIFRVICNLYIYLRAFQ